MIFDQQNMFFDKATDLTKSNVLANVGGGDPADPLFLAVFTDAALSGASTEGKAASAATFALETSDTEDFATKVVLATYEAPAGKKGLIIKAKVPYGMKKFVRLVGAGSGGKVTAGLTETVPNWEF